MGAVAAAVARGLITTGQAAELSAVFATLLRAVEASEFDRQLRAIEHGHTRADRARLARLAMPSSRPSARRSSTA